MRSADFDYLPNLTGVRGLAAAWVFALHAWEFAGAPALVLPVVALDLTPLVKCGYFGVDLFFVLSGFLLAMPFHRAALQRSPPPSLRRFWMHRCRRVLPAYWLQLALIAALYLVLGRTDAIAPRVLAAHLALVQNIVPWPVPLLNPVYWSMPVEWDFYIVLPLLAALVARCRWPAVLVAAIAAAIAFRIACYVSLHDARVAQFVGFGDVQQLPARLDQFCAGICAAWIAVAAPPSRRIAAVCLWSGITLIVVLAYVAAPREDFLVRVDVPYLFFHHTLTALGFGLLVLGAGAMTRAGAVLFANRPLMFLGTISYSLYLWHYPLLELLRAQGWLDGTRAAPWLMMLVACVPIVLALAWLSYRFVEAPFLRPRGDARPFAAPEPR